jgi:hypothetical protein
MHCKNPITLRVSEGWGSQISRQLVHEGGKVVSPTHRPPLLPRKYSRHSFLLEAESTSGLQRNDAIGNRTRDLPACSAVPKPPAPPRAPACIYRRMRSRPHGLLDLYTAYGASVLAMKRKKCIEFIKLWYDTKITYTPDNSWNVIVFQVMPGVLKNVDISRKQTLVSTTNTQFYAYSTL